MRRLWVVLALWGVPEASAAPDPAIASALSASATLVPLSVTLGLWSTGRGTREGLRFDIGMVALGAGVVVGPSVGQIYASGGVDAVVTFLIRSVTSSVMLAGVGLKLRGDDERQGLATALTALGAVPTGLLAIYDIVGAASSARETKYQDSMTLRFQEHEHLVDIARCGPIPCAR